MIQRTCTVDGCDKPQYCRGWCPAHYTRFRRYGSPEGKPSHREPETCGVESCERSVKARGYCHLHYRRFHTTGDPLGVRNRYVNPDEALAARTVREGDCILWTGTLGGNGYGRLYIGRRGVGAHRYAWERVNGPIPEGMHIDHICWNRTCVNPDHLRLATNSENASYLTGAHAGRNHDLPRNVHPNGSRFIVLLTKDGKTKSYGTYGTVDEAKVVAERERDRLFGEFAGRG